MIEGPPEESDEVASLITSEMVGAWELDPPLGVDIGVGENWLAAK
jgi:DNA polymerase-1